MSELQRQEGDLVLPPNTYAFVLDQTKGKVSVYVGPHKVSLSNTDQLVTWDSHSRKYIPVNRGDGINVFTTANKGKYIVLSNPAASGNHPPTGTATEVAELLVGSKVNIEGPVSFPLWPGQTATPVEGHHLRHNQYLLTRVYDAAQARENWTNAVLEPSGSGAEDAPVATEPPPILSMGQLDVIKGTDASFYIPPTGVEVVPQTDGQFIRNATTLETLEYCILLDETGEKRYVQGPAVVFPTPTEQFVQGRGEDRGKVKFRAVELNEQSGIYVKVIEEYEEDGVTHPVGEELFITGKDTPIYFPRREHSIIQYGDKSVHYAIALPAGEGRYVLNKEQGTVDLITGPQMFLPDPRSQVIVLRVLDPKTVDLLYPGNDEAAAVNRERDVVRSSLGKGKHLSSRSMRGFSASYSSSGHDEILASASNVADGLGGDVIQRSTTYSGPRTLTLDTKYEGAVSLNIWPGYAIMITNKTGQRRVEVGPKVVLLDYDEIVMPMELSTDRLLTTGYLRITNNLVSDEITVLTEDLVPVRVKLSYRVNFEAESEADRENWWDVENYVKVLTDHCRSRLKNKVRHVPLSDFYVNAIDVVRDTLLGESVDGIREGLLFEENGMHVYDIEVLNVEIMDAQVAHLVTEAQHQALRNSLDLESAEADRDLNSRLEELKRETLDDRSTTQLTELKNQLSIEITRLENTASLTEEQHTQALAEAENELAVARLEADADLVEQAVQFAADEHENALHIARLNALREFVDGSINDLGDKLFVEKLVATMGPAAMAAGTTTGDLLAQLLKGTPWADVLGTLNERPVAVSGAVVAGDKFRSQVVDG